MDDRATKPASEYTDLLRPFAHRLKGKKILAGTEILTGSEGQFDVILLKDFRQVSIARELLLPGGAVLSYVQNASGVATLWGGATSNGLEKRTIIDQAREAGFRHCSFYYPFPDPMSPSVMLSDAGFETLEAGNLIEPVLRAYPPELIRRLVASGLITAVSDHFLVVLSDNLAWLPDSDIFAWTFNPGRTMPYKKMNTIYRDSEGAIKVRRQELGRKPDGIAPVQQVLSEESYHPGRLYSLELAQIMSEPGWSATDVALWAAPWVELLRQHVMTTGTGEWLEGRFLDLVPFNIVDAEGRLTAIDLEWTVLERLPLFYVFFRGLYHSLARLGPIAPPSPGTPINLYGLCLQIASWFFASRKEMLEAFLTLEPHYFGRVFNGYGGPPEDIDLLIRPQDPSPVSSGAAGLYPLANLNLQIFIESKDRPFSEETSALIRIALTPERTTYAVPLPHFTGDVVRLRIDPSDHSGLVQLHAVSLQSDGKEFFSWTPFSPVEVTLSGAMILNGGPTLPNPVIILLNHDPMLIFSLPPVILPGPDSTVTLEVDVSELGPGIYEALKEDLRSLCELFV